MSTKKVKAKSFPEVTPYRRWAKFLEDEQGNKYDFLSSNSELNDGEIVFIAKSLNVNQRRDVWCWEIYPVKLEMKTYNNKTFLKTYYTGSRYLVRKI